MMKSLLIANRGEIACHIIRTARAKVASRHQTLAEEHLPAPLLG